MNDTRAGHTNTHRIHVLRAGEMICREHPGPPANWPNGHVFVREPQGRALPPVVNCPECIQRFNNQWR